MKKLQWSVTTRIAPELVSIFGEKENAKAIRKRKEQLEKESAQAQKELLKTELALLYSIPVSERTEKTKQRIQNIVTLLSL